jgi:hypothetical protein
MKKATVILFIFISYSLTYGQGLNESNFGNIDVKSSNFEKTKALIESNNF